MKLIGYRATPLRRADAPAIFSEQDVNYLMTRPNLRRAAEAFSSFDGAQLAWRVEAA